MQVQTQDYQQQIQEIQSALDTAFQELKQVNQADRKAKERIKKRIKKLTEQLTYFLQGAQDYCSV